MHKEYFKYETIEGDTFDSIALTFLKDEFKSNKIMKLNPDFIDTITFKRGIILKIPILEEKDTSTLPPWKR
ncbi:LysM domain-containing protein [Clostridium sporogenes]|uniref:LysM domain-containing protein n=1 Tax=Clostridium sporogenes TaxID=1509 RepID=UPI0015EF5176|nr:LysM domain-containing protein [Clostridium sporogenes]MBA4510227.1 LysM domain-containing protein [Clostridium sporogenes]